MAHIQGNDDGSGFGVEGTSQNDNGVIGSSNGGKGVTGHSKTGIGAFGWSENSVGLTGYSGPAPKPIIGESFPAGPPRNAGVFGYGNAANEAGVVGENVSAGSYGVFGTSMNGTGIFGASTNGEAVHGETNSTAFAAVAGIELNPNSNIAAVYGEQRGNGPALYGNAKGNGGGVFGTSANGEGVHGETNSTAFAAVAGIELNPNSNIAAVYGEQRGNGPALYGNAKGKGAGVFGISAGGPAGFFQGDVTVTGVLVANGDVVCTGGDCAEDFDVLDSQQIDAGTVMVLNDEGRLVESQRAYDRKVAGVISGAGDFKPGILLDRTTSSANRLPVALIGKVCCKVDAERAPIEVGDLLTTSATAGHAMKVQDPCEAFGAVIGKALRPLRAGRGLIPILVALQ